MLVFNKPCLVKLICAVLYSSQEKYSKTKNVLTRKFGPIDFESKEIDFTFTDYYTPEMGKPLWRRFISFKKLVSPEKIVAVKHFCVNLEKKFAPNNKRIVNLDPGYLNESRLILSTTKDFSHRIYLGKGVFAEITLLYQNNQFNDFPTTFPDYRTNQYKEILTNIRNLYRQQIKK